MRLVFGIIGPTIILVTLLFGAYHDDGWDGVVLGLKILAGILAVFAGITLTVLAIVGLPK